MSGRGQSHTELRQGRAHGATLSGAGLCALLLVRKVDCFVYFKKDGHFTDKMLLLLDIAA